MMSRGRHEAAPACPVSLVDYIPLSLCSFQIPEYTAPDYFSKVREEAGADTRGKLVPVGERGSWSPPVQLKHEQHPRCLPEPPSPPQGWSPSCSGGQPACALAHTDQGAPG